MDERMTVWIVSYFDHNDNEPTVSCFKEEEPARQCFEYFKTIHEHVAIDKIPVYNKFTWS